MERVVVISTGLATARPELCVESVRRQTVPHEHRWVDATQSGGAKIDNQRKLVADLPPSTIVVDVDLDDWLAHPRALESVVAAHEAGAWVTYGSFITADGEPDRLSRAHVPDPRSVGWYASHLKTYRAGLLQRLGPGDVAIDGVTTPLACDVAVMLPILELAGPDRVMWIREVLYVYNFREGWEANAEPDAVARERGIAAELRARPCRVRLEAL